MLNNATSSQAQKGEHRKKSLTIRINDYKIEKTKSHG